MSETIGTSNRLTGSAEEEEGETQWPPLRRGRKSHQDDKLGKKGV